MAVFFKINYLLIFNHFKDNSLGFDIYLIYVLLLICYWHVFGCLSWGVNVSWNLQASYLKGGFTTDLKKSFTTDLKKIAARVTVYFSINCFESEFTLTMPWCFKKSLKLFLSYCSIEAAWNKLCCCHKPGWVVQECVKIVIGDNCLMVSTMRIGMK